MPVESSLPVWGHLIIKLGITVSPCCLLVKNNSTLCQPLLLKDTSFKTFCVQFGTVQNCTYVASVRGSTKLLPTRTVILKYGITITEWERRRG